jgi:hypothetical protein
MSSGEDILRYQVFLPGPPVVLFYSIVAPGEDEEARDSGAKL